MQLYARCAVLKYYTDSRGGCTYIRIALSMYIKFEIITLFVPIFRVPEQCVQYTKCEISYITVVTEILMLQLIIYYYCVRRSKIAQQQLPLSAADNIHI